MSANNADFDSAPEPFRGTRSQVGPFLAQLDEEFKAQPDVFSSDHAKVSPHSSSSLRLPKVNVLQSCDCQLTAGHVRDVEPSRCCHEVGPRPP